MPACEQNKWVLLAWCYLTQVSAGRPVGWPPAYQVALIEMHASKREPAAHSPLILALTFYAVM
jgi:hypothetical protein